MRWNRKEKDSMSSEKNDYGVCVCVCVCVCSGQPMGAGTWGWRDGGLTAGSGGGSSMDDSYCGLSLIFGMDTSLDIIICAGE